jgi:glutathione S-transferase
MGKDGFAEEEIAKALDDVRKTAARMDAMLAQSGGPWLLGGQLTLADVCVAPLIDRMEDLGFAWLWDEFPTVADWLKRIQARPAYRQAFYKGSRLSEIYPDLQVGARPRPPDGSAGAKQIRSQA